MWALMLSGRDIGSTCLALLRPPSFAFTFKVAASCTAPARLEPAASALPCSWSVMRRKRLLRRDSGVYAAQWRTRTGTVGCRFEAMGGPLPLGKLFTFCLTTTRKNWWLQNLRLTYSVVLASARVRAVFSINSGTSILVFYEKTKSEYLEGTTVHKTGEIFWQD